MTLTPIISIDIPTPLLSICIPTFNRAEYLRKLLLSIREQTYQLNYEIRVRDNGSTDQTESIFKEIAGTLDNWFYEKNINNLGGKANIRLCTEGARGDYIHIVGDDDYFLPNAFLILDSLLKRAAIENVSSIFLNENIPSAKDNLVTSFIWLKYVSINAPAFITGVIWKAEVWLNYHYFDYPPEFSLPQLDCFIKSCIDGKTLLSNQVMFNITHAQSTSDINYWFVSRHALVDCFEYPELYTKVLQYPDLDFSTFLSIYLRRISLLREICKKILVMYYCKDVYKDTLFLFEKIHGNDPYGFIILTIKNFVFHSRLGNYISRKYCEKRKDIRELSKQKSLSNTF